VAITAEGIALRQAGNDAPVLVLAEPPAADFPALVHHHLTPVVYHADAVAALDEAAAAGGGASLPVHLKVDTGMHRVGADPDDALELAQAIADARYLRLEGLMTHLAVADEPDDPFTARQLERLEAVRTGLRDRGIEPPLVHAANSAGGIAHPAARYSLVRAGIAVYGIAPGPGLVAASAALRPVLSLRAKVSHVRRVAAGDGVSYGLRHRFERDTVVATLPLGYADGVPRRLSAAGGEVLLGGRRCPMVGVVTMDQLMVDCGPRATVRRGDQAVLIGEQGGERITAADWAERIGTIGYEVV
jgi:alanine racemase